MMSSLLSGLTLLFFSLMALGACALVGNLLFDLIPVLRDGDERVRKQLRFPEIGAAPATREPAAVYRIAPVGGARIALSPLRVAA